MYCCNSVNQEVLSLNNAWKHCRVWNKQEMFQIRNTWSSSTINWTLYLTQEQILDRDEPNLRLDGNDTSAKEKENLGQNRWKLQEQIPQNTESITLLTSQSRIQSKKLLKLHKHGKYSLQGGIVMDCHNRRDKSSVPCLNCREKGNYANEPKKFKRRQVK